MPRVHLAAFLTALLCAASIPGPASAADETPPAAPAVSNATILAANAYPGVQLISTTYTATVRVAIPVINQVAVEALGQRLATQALSGAIDITEEALTEAIVDAIVKAPNTYFVAGRRTYSKRNSLVGVGTGWVITPNGYLITAAHVVNTPTEELRQEFAANSLAKFGRQFVRGLEGSGTQLTGDQVDRLTNAILGWLADRMSVEDLDVTVAANLALGVDGVGKEQKPVTAEVVDVGTPYPGNDVALLKIDGQEHLPTVSLGDNDDVVPGATVHVVGYPAASTFSPGLSADAQVQPTVTEGPVTAVKSTGGGMPVFQTQAPASPGNSGGPVLTDNGTSVGVLVATAVNSDGSAAQGQAFVIPASEVQDMLKQNGVEAEQSDTTAAYAKAVNAFYAQRYREAVPLFEKAETLYPAHPYAAKFIADSKSAIDQGLDKTPVVEKDSTNWVLWLAIAVAVLLLLLIAALVGLLLFLRGRKSQSGGALVPPPYVAPPQPQTAVRAAEPSEAPPADRWDGSPRPQASDRP